MKAHAGGPGPLDQGEAEALAIGRVVVGQVQRRRQRRRRRELGHQCSRLGGAQQPVAYPLLVEHGPRGPVHLDVGLGPEQLEIALAPVVIDAELIAQGTLAVAAEPGDPLHPRAIAAIALGRALTQPAREPAPLRRRKRGPDDDGRGGLEQLAGQLARHPRCGPGGHIAGRHDAGIAGAGGLGRAAQRVMDVDLMAALAQIPGGGDADDAGADHRDSAAAHIFP